MRGRLLHRPLTGAAQCAEDGPRSSGQGHIALVVEGVSKFDSHLPVVVHGVGVGCDPGFRWEMLSRP